MAIDPGGRFVDQGLICIDCDEAFVWTAGEQQFYADKQLQTPRRCPPCRLVRRAERTAQAQEGLVSRSTRR
jgi:hypothetical protein